MGGVGEGVRVREIWSRTREAHPTQLHYCPRVRAPRALKDTDLRPNVTPRSTFNNLFIHCSHFY